MAASVGPIVFVVIVVGGLGSLTGAFVASLLIGILQTFMVAAVDRSSAGIESSRRTMHQAYERLTLARPGFRIFISGPSKTADIEQALVIGAHGPRSTTVFLIA